MTDADRPNDQLEALLHAFWNDIEQFHISPTFDAKGTYTECKARELEEIRAKYRTAIVDCLTKRTLGIETPSPSSAADERSPEPSHEGVGAATVGGDSAQLAPLRRQFSHHDSCGYPCTTEYVRIDEYERIRTERDEAVSSLDSANKECDRLRDSEAYAWKNARAIDAERCSILKVIQAYQPQGSPPPGDGEALARWALDALSSRIEQLRSVLAIVRGYVSAADTATIGMLNGLLDREEGEPPLGLLVSMAIRADHGLGVPGYYDNTPIGAPGITHRQRLQSAVDSMRQIWEEVAGRGFYRPEKDAEYAAMLGDAHADR